MVHCHHWSINDLFLSPSCSFSIYIYNIYYTQKYICMYISHHLIPFPREITNLVCIHHFLSLCIIIHRHGWNTFRLFLNFIRFTPLWVCWVGGGCSFHLIFWISSKLLKTAVICLFHCQTGLHWFSCWWAHLLVYCGRVFFGYSLLSCHIAIALFHIRIISC